MQQACGTCTWIQRKLERRLENPVPKMSLFPNNSIIETTEVTLRVFDEVDAQFAYEEGEYDRTFESWREKHWKYFSRVLPQIGKQPTPQMLLVCERFRIVYS